MKLAPAPRLAPRKVAAGGAALAFITLLTLNASAKETRYKDYPLELKDGDHLVVQGIRGSVKLTASSSKNLTIRVLKKVSDHAPSEDQARFDSATYNVRRDGSQVFIEATGPDSRTTYAQWMKAPAPEMNFEIEAPSLPAEVSLHGGTVTAQNWKQPLEVNLVSGSIKTTGTEGSLRLQLQKGEIKIDKHRGRTEIDSYAAKLTAQDIEGDVDLTNFSGESNLSAINGSIDLRSNSGASSIAKSTGAVDFLAGRGSVNLTGFEGPVRGTTDQASVVAGIEGEAEVHIESNQGPVTVKLPSDTGALVKIQSEEGYLTVPEDVRSPASARTKRISGHLSGDGPKGTVIVKSKTGNVRVKI